MSPESTPGHAAHPHEIEMPHASLRDYLIGFALSVVLTAIPFWLVMTMPLSAGATAAIIMGFAVVQIVVHMIFFLHMTPKAEGGWSLTSLVFTIIVLGIALAGSLWVMHHLNTNMMPMPHDMNQLP
ncbi:cytochrome o ubiquinol oxidase subunit IV [Sphingopyxis panaciterrulae]|uniref:Cytochrome bo(3) ubiquinol oxidase subunit 4 n=1 Tax=Sphingopyxis panaciterrulae TaxID=462372 RepID=A0A7W9B5J6_9SPHN|nr:cytochrome o ubiquinol oxidase subunit IV [Sphingopyxis panaciterrulae]MBB5706674.1 cytochrome o ubiquinol oxidase operon protein cyoD [Sphingopyxis panaciterrulae]